jgi:hypothetical protein
MDGLKEGIARTILVPDFLHEWVDEYKDEVVSLTFQILDLYYRGVNKELLTNNQVKRLCRKIDRISADLLGITPPYLHLQGWIWIGETIEEWIQLAIFEEEFESAANLRKLLNSEYV